MFKNHTYKKHSDAYLCFYWDINWKYKYHSFRFEIRHFPSGIMEIYKKPSRNCLLNQISIAYNFLCRQFEIIKYVHNFPILCFCFVW